MSFEGFEYSDCSSFREAICTRIRALFREHHVVFEDGRPSELKVQRYREIIDGTAGEHIYVRALFYLSQYLYEHHGERVVILIEDYDTPVLAGQQHGYARDVRDWHERFLMAALKDNPHLYKAVVMGTVRLPLGSLWSGSNLVVSSLLESNFADAFGFAEAEVEELLDRVGRRDDLALVRDWYGAYKLGGTIKYKPSSVLRFFAQNEREPKVFLPACSRGCLRALLHRRDLREAVQTLLAGDLVELPYPLWMTIEPPMFDETIWRLVFMGYLTAEMRSRGPGELPVYHVSVPNEEMRLLIEALAGR
ncbi:AAA family ATPase [Polyangium jinanense]|nr:AAA family ATPase [Polyangium jinanense]